MVEFFFAAAERTAACLVSDPEAEWQPVGLHNQRVTLSRIVANCCFLSYA
jgi:hypothetical protein